MSARHAGLAALSLALAASSARAEPTPGADGEGGAPTFSYERLYVRAGILHVAPLSDSREVVLSGVDGPASLALMPGPIAGSGAALAPMTVPAVIVGYALPVWNDALSIETVLGAPLHVTFRATGTLAARSIAPEALGIPTGVPPLGTELGEADAAPPMVTAVYRLGRLGPVSHYLGLGVNLLVTYNARATNPVLTEAGTPTFHIDPAPGLVLQTGIDVAVWRRVALRADVKYIAFMKAHATVADVRVRTPSLPLFETAEVGTATLDMWVNPLIVQLGLGVDL